MTAQQRFTHGNLTALNSQIDLDVAGLNTAMVQVTGTFVGTISFQASLDGIIFNSAKATPVDVDTAAVRSLTAPGVWEADVTAYKTFRVKMTSFTSGVAAIYEVGSPGIRAI